MAGGAYGSSNSSYYLYNGQTYWTMSPCYKASGPRVFYVYDNGYLAETGAGVSSSGIRPVINLRSDVTFEDGGKGTSSKPFIVAN